MDTHLWEVEIIPAPASLDHELYLVTCFQMIKYRKGENINFTVEKLNKHDCGQATKAKQHQW